jgi:hypothetical protein
MVAEVLAYASADSGAYTAEKHAALNLARALTERAEEFRNLPLDRASALSRKVTQLGAAAAVQPSAADINSVTVDRGLSIAQTSSAEVRDSMYQQLANNAATAGDFERARQIINDYLPPSTRARALAGAQRQAVYAAASKGNFDEALRLIQSERSVETRVTMLGQIVAQIGPGLKNSTATSLLEQIRSMLGPSPRAEGEEEMKTLLSLTAALSRFNPDRVSGIIEPLVDQFNELCLSAVAMNGFRQKYYRNGDLIMEDNNLATLGKQFAKTLAALSLRDTPRARAAADRMRPVTVRIEIYLAMAENSIRSSNWVD